MLPPETMKALTLYPTWAVLIMLERKKIETRGWTSAYRGPIAITASARLTDEDRYCFDLPIFQSVLAPAGYRSVRDLPRGVVVCTALLTGILNTEEVRAGLTEEEAAFGNYEPGRFAWQLQGIERVQPLLPCRGRQMLWDVDLAALRAAHAAKPTCSGLNDGKAPKIQSSKFKAQTGDSAFEL